MSTGPVADLIRGALLARVTKALSFASFANKCHAPAGPGGGRFCSATGGAGTPGGAKAGKIVGNPGTQLASAKPTEDGTSYKAGDITRLGYDTIQGDAVGKVIARIAAVPGFEDFKGRTDREALTEIAERQAEHIEDAYDIAMRIDNGIGTTKAHSDWYPYVNRWAHDMSDTTGFPPEAVMAATAVLSPGADWADNVAWSEQVIHIIKNEKTITVEKGWLAAQEQAAKASYKKSVLDHDKENAKLVAEGKEPKPPFAGKKPVDGEWARLAGMKLSELTPEEAAVAIRGAHEMYGKMVHQKGNGPGLGDAVNKARPQSAPNFAKAISILRDSSTENIDRELGGSHKVRSFYQNMRDPFNTKQADVTVDSHHMGLALGLPMTGEEPMMKSVYGSPTNKKTGLVGTYPLAVEATRIAAARINKKHRKRYTPAQVQSIAWEAQRALYAKKSSALTGKIAAIRSAYRKGGMPKGEMLALIENARLDTGNALGHKNITVEEIRKQFAGELTKGSN